MLHIYGRMLAVGTWINTKVPLLQRLRPKAGADAGEGPLGFIVLAAAIFLLAVAVAAKITQVVNDYMGKIK
ncbi:hypothetical protein [Microbispora amethystogenes]|uniref:DUF2970 domain-containing protein n=1 Tax=Microbispora amethystogenes TaxID=1427754 RepID=A0ABQ4F6K7_9ACTN|nr:hypothetical protein [Microbispora amethystogenes]GIH30449.1 hypothetical protein Mam01_06130 [Microbispora amethystogenes]